MAKLVGVCRSEDYKLQRRQFPFVMDDTLEFIVQFPDMCTNCHGNEPDQKEMNSFVKKFRSVPMDDLMQATSLSKQFLVNQLSQNVQCVGCRRSVEKLIEEFAKVSHRAMVPLGLSCTGSVSVMPEYLTDPKFIYSLLYVQSSCFSVDVRSRKGKRCILHSLDAHKSKALWSWQDILDLSSSECQEEILLVDFDNLHQSLDDYLRKHRFCSDCKNKVTNAYRILVKEIDGAGEKGFCPSLYEGIKVCGKERHFHVSSEDKFIRSLIERAEPEIAGNQREQHAKTMDVAQEEVLACLGIHLHDRFIRLLQKLKVEEKSWLILYSLSVEAIRKNIETTFEKKLGRYSVDNLVNELVSGEEQVRTPVKQTRRRKKKCKKTEGENASPSYGDEKVDHETHSAVAERAALKVPDCSDVGLAGQDDNHNIVLPANYQCQCVADVCHRAPTSRAETDGPGQHLTCGVKSGSESFAHGDSSANAGVCESCDARSNTKVVPERCCAFFHTQDSPLSLCNCSRLGISCVNCHLLSSQTLSSHSNSKMENGDRGAGDVSKDVFSNRSFCDGFSRYDKTLSLQEMLKTPYSSGDEESCEIDEEEILQFKANEQHVMWERQRLRQTLRQRFATLQQRCFCPKTRGEYAAGCNVNVVSAKLAEISTE